MIRRFIDQARQAQIKHDTRIDVQLPLVASDLPSALGASPGRTPRAGSGGPPDAPVRDGSGRSGALGQGLTAEPPKPPPHPLTDRIKLHRVANNVDRVRATLIRCVDLEAPLTLDELADVVDVLESISAYARADRLVRASAEPQSLRVDNPPTLRRVK